VSGPISLLSPAPKQASLLAPLSYGAVESSQTPPEVQALPVFSQLLERLRAQEAPNKSPMEIGFEPLTSGASNLEAYEVYATEARITLRAHQTAGFRHAIHTLIQWLQIQPEGQACLGLQVQDEPDLPERGVMLDISRDRVPTLATTCQLVELLASWKINRLQLYTEHTFAYSAAPHICAPSSPWTPSEIRALDEHASLYGIELVPNQQSFGHMHRWLSHDSHRHLAEIPGGVQHPFHPLKQPFSLCPTDPKALEFLAELYDELLPNFTSKTFNVGLDETFDLGEGRSRAAVSERGVAAVYLDFLCSVHELVASRGHRMQCWADVILNHPEVVPDLPSDCEPILWGYEAEHPIEKEAAVLSASCSSFQIAPGTSSWQSFGGRTDNCLSNMKSAGSAARTHGAKGVLITDWGDRGHLQPLPVSYLGFLYGAECSWNGPAAEGRTDQQLAALLDHLAFRSPSCGLGEFTLELGRAADSCGVKTENLTALFYPIGFPERTLPDERVPGLVPESYERGRAKISELKALHSKISPASGESSLSHDEFSWVLDLMDTACDLGTARTSSPPGQTLSDLPGTTGHPIAERLRELGNRHADLWLVRSRPGGLKDSVARLEGIAEALHPTPRDRPK